MEKQTNKNGGMMKYLTLMFLCLSLVGCTQTMTMVHTQGEADDVVDETATSSPTITPTITVPISPL